MNFRLAPLTLTLAIAVSVSCGCQPKPQPASASDIKPPIVAPAVTPTASASGFDADVAYRMLADQCDMGPRPPGSPAHEKCLAYILDHLSPHADHVTQQHFAYRDTDRHVNLNLTNVIGVINPAGKRKVMLFTHWDTRPTADQELDDVNKKKPIIGADDGASGTAVLLELARVLHDKRPDACVELLFVDGEDWGPGEDKMYLGARYFAKNPGRYRPDYAILLDMIGDKDLDIHREQNSQKLHPELNDKVWNAAAAIGDAQYFPNDTKYLIGDDHDSFNDKGIPAIDLIDFDYAYWHTLQDTADKCSPASLKVVGDVMARVISEEK